MKKYEVGDVVIIDGDSSFCHRSEETILKIEDRYDEITGKKYQLLFTQTGSFRSDNGWCVGGPSMYYLVRK